MTSKRDWEVRRRELRHRWLEFLGPMKMRRPSDGLTTLEADSTEAFDRKLVRYEVEPGLWVEGYLLLPRHRAGAKLPGIVAFHSTSFNTIRQTAGLADAPSLHLGPLLCEAGFAVFCPRCFLWQNASSYEEAVGKHRERHPRALGMRKMLHDGIRAVDVIASLPEVDPGRIGAVGHSLGAKETLYLAAFDERVKAAAFSEGGIALRSTNWSAPWYLGPEIEKPGFALNHHQLLALIAPRPFLAIAGERGQGAADGHRSWPAVAAAQPAYAYYGTPVRMGVYNHERGHVLDKDIHSRIREWLLAYV